MKKIRNIFLMLISILSVALLVSCGKTASIEVTNVSAMRTRISISVIVEDNNNAIAADSISAKIYHVEEDILVKTEMFDELDDEEQTVIFDELDVVTEYRIVIKATVDGKSVTFYNENVSTTEAGASADNPIEISTKEQFTDIAYAPDAYYKLVNDIDFVLDDDSKQNITPLFNKSEPFIGHFDGNNKKISNININSSNTYIGLFGYIGKEASVKNLTISKIDVKTTKGSELYLGVLTGCNEGIIENVDIDTVTINHQGQSTSKQYIGTLTGVNTGSIKDCDVKDVTMDVRSRNQSTVGGFVGTNGGIIHTATPNTIIDTCSVTNVLIDTEFNTVRAASEDDEYFQYTGGFVGETRSDIINSFADQVKIKSTAKLYEVSIDAELYEVSLGGFAGRVINGCKITGCASAANIDFSSSDVYTLYAGVLFGSAIDAVVKDTFGFLTGINGVLYQTNYEDPKDKEDVLKASFGICGNVDNMLVNNPVGTSSNVGYKLATDASILSDTADITGYVGISDVAATSLDTSNLKEFVLNMVNIYNI